MQVLDFLLRAEGCELLKQDVEAMMFSRDTEGRNALQIFLERDNIDVARRFLDWHISTTESDPESCPEKSAICLDLSCMLGKKSENNNKFEKWALDETMVIKTMLTKTGEKHKIFQHPIINTFVTVKYNSYTLLISTIIVMRFLFCLALTGITGLFHGTNHQHITQENETETKTEPEPKIATFDEIAEETPLVFWSCLIFMFVHCSLMLFRKIWITCKLRSHTGFTRDRTCSTLFGSLLHVATLVYIACLAFINREDISNYSWIKYLSAALVLSSWVSFTTFLRYILLGWCHNLGMYIHMLSQIFKKVFVFFLIYFALLVGFAMAFFLIFPATFQSPFAINRAVTMMLGEFNYDDKFKNESSFSPSQFLFFVFVIMVPIVVQNLLIGLTVSDVKDLIENANTNSLASKMKTVAIFNYQDLECFDKIAKYLYKQSSQVSYDQNSMKVNASLYSYFLHFPGGNKT